MQQRRVRLGDVLDDYCPRERRITNHAVVAMLEDDVKQTRCTTCDAEHEYKHAKVPAARRKKPVAAVAGAPADAAAPPILVVADETVDDTVEDAPDLSQETIEAVKEPDAADAVNAVEAIEAEAEEPVSGAADEEWPVHRPLIRATLPRPEGQTPERKPTDFTIRQPGGRFDGQRNGNKGRPNRHARQAQGQSSGQPRFGNPRGSGQGSRHGGGQPAGNQQRQGNRPGPPGQRGGRPGPGGANRPGQGRGPKRGR
jgi:translation initiation factor IF-2